MAAPWSVLCGSALALGMIAAGAAQAATDPAPAPTAPPAPAAQKPGTIGLVMGDWRFALYETPNGKDECPEGFQFDATANYNAQFPTPEARKAREEKFGYYTNRGPNGENVYYHPTVMKDPLPFRAVHGTTAIGMNLDGEAAGRGGGLSLPHDNFTSPDGETGIDNQLYRVIGCTPGWRKNGGISGPTQIYLRTEQQVRILLEVTGVDDEQNDNDVTLTFYRGLDPVAADTQDKLIPWLSQRIDYKLGRRYIHRFKGKIVDGVLISEPTDLLLPALERPARFGDRVFKQARLRVKLNPVGGEGMLGGYVDTEAWYLLYAKSWGAHKVADIEGWSGPATYQALKQYSDYRDPVTGEATGISAAYQIGFVRTFIVHTPQSDAVIAEVAPPETIPTRRTASR